MDLHVVVDVHACDRPLAVEKGSAGSRAAIGRSKARGGGTVQPWAGCQVGEQLGDGC
jgi:hypothetical protein